jgi:hypothetical protein
MMYAGHIKKVEHKQVGGKALVDLSLCKKQKGRNGAEDSFVWLRVSLWEPAAFMIPKLVKGAFISGSGEFSVRTYDKDGVEKISMECRSGSFDVEIAGDAEPQQAAQPEPTPVKVAHRHVPAVAVGGTVEDEIPFAPDRISH